MLLVPDLVKDGDIKTVEDLLQPRWKGKMAWFEPWSNGGAFTAATAMRLEYGDDILKRIFIDQEPHISRDFRVLTEDIVRGKYAFGTANAARINEMRAEGLAKNVKELDIPDLTMIRENSVFVFNKPPHPNAGMVFVNWLLSKAGQEAWSKAGQFNSRRRDVAPQFPGVLTEGDEKRYVRANTEETLPRMTATQEMLKQLLVN